LVQRFGWTRTARRSKCSRRPFNEEDVVRGLSRISFGLSGLAAVVALGIALSAPAGAQDSDSGGDEDILRIGWSQDPSNINPYVGQDEEAYNLWSLNWDLLVNFDPEDLTPAPGIAESWEVSDDKKTITFKLVDANWSDGKPITSKDVKYSLEVFGDNGVLFTNYNSNITKVETPDAHTVIVHTKKPDARIIGGLFIYILPEHIWGKVPVKELTGSYKPELPLVGSGPYIVTEYDKGHIVRMERNPEFRGEAPAFDEIQFIKYGNDDAVERALKLGEIDMIREVQPTAFERLGEEDNIETIRSSSPSYTQLAFNMCPERFCPDAELNPAIQDGAVRQAVAYAVDRERVNTIATHDTSFVAHGILPEFYKSFYEIPAEDYPYDPDRAREILDEAGWQDNGDDPRTKGDETLSFNLYVRSESKFTIDMAKEIALEAAEVGIEFNVQVVSTDKLYDLTVRKVDGKPAPEFDTFIWGWGGDPYDPSFLLSVLLQSEIGGLSDSFYANPEYDKLFKEQAGSFDVAERKEIIQRMVAIAQRDLPYLVLSYDPLLEAWRTDRIEGVEPLCPAETGDAICQYVSYEPMLSLTPGSGSSSDEGGGESAGLAVIAALVFGIGGWWLGSRQSRRRESEPLEIEG
jgi:peptide/nickel transport system substrate-binding protein